MSWGATDDLSPPPKPARVPLQGNFYQKKKFSYILSELLFDTGIDTTSLNSLSPVSSPVNVPQTYIVAQNPEVLAHLMKENESRGLCPSAYTTPASVFNTIAVDFEKSSKEQGPVLKTCPIAVQSLQKLDPEVSDLENQMKQKISALETSTSSKGSDEKVNVDYPKLNPELNSFPVKPLNSGTFPKLGSIESNLHNTSPKLGSLERNIHTKKSNGTFSPKMGSLERSYNRNTGCISQVSKMFESNSKINYQSNKIEQECIYDFGGANVKSCANKQPFPLKMYGSLDIEKTTSKMKVRDR